MNTLEMIEEYLTLEAEIFRILEGRIKYYFEQRYGKAFNRTWWIENIECDTGELYVTVVFPTSCSCCPDDKEYYPVRLFLEDYVEAIQEDIEERKAESEEAKRIENEEKERQERELLKKLKTKYGDK